VPVLLTRARLAAIAGQLDDARAALAAARDYTDDLHLDVAEVVISAVSGLVDALSGDHQRAQSSYRRSQALLLQMGRPLDALAYEAYAARQLFEQGSVIEADLAAHRLAQGAQVLDLRTRVMVSALLGRIAVASGECDTATSLAVAATALSDQTDDLCLQGDSYTDLAIVAVQAGQPATAADAAATALRRYQAKGASMLAARAQRLIAAAGDRSAG
jgi:ATP/maltotriose-dependent transcriptional regulator MalT